MSSGPFVILAYQANYDINAFHPVKVQPETVSLTININGTNVDNTGGLPSDITNPISCRVSGGTRTLGLNAAKIRLEWTGTPPAGYDPNGILTLPLLNSAIRSASRGATGTYLNVAVRVVGTTPEIVN